MNGLCSLSSPLDQVVNAEPNLQHTRHTFVQKMSFICICTIYLCRVHMKCKKTSIAIQLRRLYRLVLVFVNIFVLIICRCVCICKYVWIDICMYLGVYMYLYCKTTVPYFIFVTTITTAGCVKTFSQV